LYKALTEEDEEEEGEGGEDGEDGEDEVVKLKLRSTASVSEE
jgi:hypothetical protein